ncbi:glycosyltransferase family 4 protein [Algibacter amylolyticus]|uniref:Glycosyltransferase family 4 protein n=1 Tax=Algibacter amylolyticus TaxID=1608400 RepID=A0A5M7BI55_9FLAO|nr:glycosyltransferase [Algibacter amylolyticus]KAA5827414.1 glycosyltransferase family 4 protein [Algibacter amylolyticus]MBB5266606.1 glycosyltransferase involved in cell wall biosynthesis [Algibacter amylolyticus]TSJ81659.1 glycosyltransferase family 4 protein [Algibacter amylolyticus]
MKKIKIAQILDSVGGVEVYLRLITENMDSNSFENIIIHKKNENKKGYLDNSQGLISEFDIDIQREIHVIKDLKAIFKTVKILKKEKPDLIHAHSAKGGIIARAASLFYNVKVLHTPHAYSYLSANNKLKARLFLSLEKLFKHFNSYLLATSESERNRGINEVGYKEEKALLLNNSILPIPKKNIDLSFNLKENYICTVARPSFQKNLEMMINVVKKLKETQPDINLIILGVGEYSPNKEVIKGMIVDFKLENNVQLIEWMERDMVFEVISKSKLYISTSRYEGLPYSVIESLALSKACVVTNCDGNRDLVKNNYNGFVVEHEDVEFMAKKISYLLDNSKIREKFEKKSLELFEANFNLNVNIKNLEKFYKTFCKK